MESRQLIDELKAHNDKLQRDVYALVSNQTTALFNNETRLIQM